MTVLIHVDTNKPVGDKDHLKVCARLRHSSRFSFRRPQRFSPFDWVGSGIDLPRCKGPPHHAKVSHGCRTGPDHYRLEAPRETRRIALTRRIEAIRQLAAVATAATT